MCTCMARTKCQLLVSAVCVRMDLVPAAGVKIRCVVSATGASEGLSCHPLRQEWRVPQKPAPRVDQHERGLALAAGAGLCVTAHVPGAGSWWGYKCLYLPQSQCPGAQGVCMCVC